MRLRLKNSSRMTAVIDIPDELYQKVTARVAALGRRVPEVTVELYERWLGDEKMASVPPTANVTACSLLRMHPVNPRHPSPPQRIPARLPAKTRLPKAAPLTSLAPPHRRQAAAVNRLRAREAAARFPASPVRVPMILRRANPVLKPALNPRPLQSARTRRMGPLHDSHLLS